MLIKEIYRQNPKTVLQTASVSEVVDLMSKDRINGLVVLDSSERVTGIISLQDIAAATVPSQFRKNIRMAAAMYRKGFFTEMCQHLKDVSVKKIMRTEFVSVSLDDNIMAVTADFLKNDLYIVPVVAGKKLLGVVTRSEIKKAIAYGMRAVRSTE